MKYKHAESPGHYYKIDELGNKSASFNQGKPKTSAAGMYKEMMIWVEAGGVIEPQYNAEEQAAKDQAESEAAAVAWIGERQSEYLKEGCTEKNLIVALWEKVVENRPEAADALEVKRQAVKVKIPKPA